MVIEENLGNQLGEVSTTLLIQIETRCKLFKNHTDALRITLRGCPLSQLP